MQRGGRSERHQQLLNRHRERHQQHRLNRYSFLLLGRRKRGKQQRRLRRQPQTRLPKQAGTTAARLFGVMSCLFHKCKNRCGSSSCNGTSSRRSSSSPTASPQHGLRRRKERSAAAERQLPLSRLRQAAAWRRRLRPLLCSVRQRYSKRYMRPEENCPGSRAAGRCSSMQTDIK